MVFPKPEELKFRADRRYKEMGKEVPADAVNNMLGTLSFLSSFCIFTFNFFDLLHS